MKRFLLSIAILTVFSLSVYAISESDENPDDDTQFVYETNGKGDQFIKFSLSGEFPLNFGNPFDLRMTNKGLRLNEGNYLYLGGAAELGYYRFLNSWLAIGGDFMVAYHATIGSNSLTMVPITLGAIIQPTLGKIEFPINLTTGIGFETCQNKKYFPSFVIKAELGAFYRITEGWSAGISANYLFIAEKDDVGQFAQASISARYHF